MSPQRSISNFGSASASSSRSSRNTSWFHLSLSLSLCRGTVGSWSPGFKRLLLKYRYGFGLGLSVVKKLVAQLGPSSHISVKSEVNAGSEFMFYLYQNVKGGDSQTQPTAVTIEDTTDNQDLSPQDPEYLTSS